LATWLAALTTTNGFAAAPALALIAWRQQQRPRLVAGFAALTVTFGPPISCWSAHPGSTVFRRPETNGHRRQRAPLPPIS
jgi:hypothetical protein